MVDKVDVAWSEAQIMAARAITLIKRHMPPLCDGCGYNADRPNCVNGGYCARHEQENVIAYHKVIAGIERGAKFPRDFYQRWDLFMPLHLYNDFDEEEKALLLDLAEAGGKLKSRKPDNRFNSLSSKQAVSYSAQGGYEFVTLSKRGEDLVKLFSDAS